jgi:hypothetical protein
MIRSLALSISALALLAGLAFADPGVEVRYVHGVPQIHLEGNYPQARYTVYRADAADGPWVSFTDVATLCMGPCYGEDLTALPGRTYWYRFDLQTAEGALVSHGPYAVTISSVLARGFGARVVPNPSRGQSRVEIFVAGAAADAPVPARAMLFDLQGRAVRTLWSGPVVRGLTTRVAWDGRGDDGRAIGAGQYYLRLETPLGAATTRVLRVN